MKTVKKILIGILVWTIVVGFVVYEAYSITRKEYIRQTDIATSAHQQVNFNLDMIKIAVMTEDVETYENNLNGLREQMNTISSLSFLYDEQSEYLGKLRDYIELLSNKTALLEEMSSLKSDVLTVKNKISENYSDKNTLTREKLTEAKSKVLEFKINASNYAEEKALTVANSVNDLLQGVSDKVSTLVDCVDTCYKNRIVEINDELSEAINSFTNNTDALNSGLEAEFDFAKMKEIKEY